MCISVSIAIPLIRLTLLVWIHICKCLYSLDKGIILIKLEISNYAIVKFIFFKIVLI